MKLIELDIVNFGRQIFDLTGASIQTSYKIRDSGYSLFLSDGTQLPLNESYDSLRQRLMEAGMLVGLPPAQDVEPCPKNHEDMLCDLLCRIHRVGRRYIYDYGIEKACIDAEAKVDERILRAYDSRSEMLDARKEVADE